MAAGSPHISISAEHLFSIGGLNVNNSMLTSLIVSGLLIAFALWVRASLRNTSRPTGVQNVAEWIVESLTGMVHAVTGDKKKTDVFFPLIASFFLFILLNNWFGLLPGVGTIGFKHVVGQASNPWNVALAPSTLAVPHPVPLAHAATGTDTHAAPAAGTAAPHVEEPHDTGAAVHQEGSAHVVEGEHGQHEVFVPYLRAGTADLNMTLALGILSVGAVQYFGFKYLKFGYLKKYFNFSSPINFFVGILELVSEFSKILSFAFRLFGNVFAGEVLLVVISFIAAVIAPMPFYGLELFVGFIQALVFSMLSVVLFNMATASHDEH
jgi:F-type H+-transporting ATPase subunit a